MTPVAGLSRKPRLHGILVDVAEGDGELAEAFERPRVEAFAPEMPRYAALFVVGPREIPQDPPHDRREALAPRGPQLQMGVIPHHAEVGHLETVTLLGARQKNEKQVANLPTIEEHLAPIDARGDVVPRAFYQLPGTSHDSHTPSALGLNSIGDCPSR